MRFLTPVCVAAVVLSFAICAAPTNAQTKQTPKPKHAQSHIKEVPLELRVKKLYARFKIPTLKQIYWESIAAENKADNYATRFEHDNPEPSTTLPDYQALEKAWWVRRHRVQETRNEIEEREWKRIARKWKITDQELQDIGGEGSWQKWPMPQ